MKIEALTESELVTKDYLEARLSKQENKLIVWMVGLQLTTIGLLLAFG